MKKVQVECGGGTGVELARQGNARRGELGPARMCSAGRVGHGMAWQGAGTAAMEGG